jgi:hypothetical protein
VIGLDCQQGPRLVKRMAPCLVLCWGLRLDPHSEIGMAHHWVPYLARYWASEILMVIHLATLMELHLGDSTVASLERW